MDGLMPGGARSRAHSLAISLGSSGARLSGKVHQLQQVLMCKHGNYDTDTLDTRASIHIRNVVNPAPTNLSMAELKRLRYDVLRTVGLIARRHKTQMRASYTLLDVEWHAML